MGLLNGRMERCDAVTAFLSEVMDDPRLTFVTGARVDRILFEGARAVGVALAERRPAPARARATREVLVAAGTYNTAKLLMLSGIGPAAAARAHGLPVSADLPPSRRRDAAGDHHEVPVIAHDQRAERLLRPGPAAGTCSATACNISSSTPGR